MTAATEVAQVSYLARTPDQVLIIDPQDEERNYRGQVIRQFPRTVVQFVDYRATITTDKQGRTVVNGSIVPLPYDELLERLDTHTNFGTTFWRYEEPPEPRPTMDELAELLETADADKLRELVAIERAGHNRPEALGLLSDAALTLAENEAKVAAAPTVESVEQLAAPEAPGDETTESEQPAEAVLPDGSVEEPDGDSVDV